VGGFIVLDDGRAYGRAGWAYRATIEAIADALPDTEQGSTLAEWLTNPRTLEIYPTVDVRELTPANRELFLAAAERAFDLERQRGPLGWANPEFRESWLKAFAELVQMIHCVRRGEPPKEYNPHMTDTLPATGEHSGPGW
jgi:hypothetical protein